MPRKLKIYLTASGFFELAVAAPSMKAALELWGSNGNLFQQGLARETDDPKIVKAAMAHPGVVLRRPIGTQGGFAEQAELPTLASLATAERRAGKSEPVKPKARAETAKKKEDASANREAARLYDLAQKRREREERKAEAEREKERERRDRAIAKAQAALDEARARHEARAAEITAEREKLERKLALEKQRWAEEEAKLEEARRRARQ